MYLLLLLHFLPLKGIFIVKAVLIALSNFLWTIILGSFPFCICDIWGNEPIRVTDSLGELSHRICCGQFQIYFYRSSEIILWDDSYQLWLSMLIFLQVHISLLWIFNLTLSLVKMTIIIRMFVRCRCCLFFFLLDCGEDCLHFLDLIFGCIFLDLCFLVLQ